MHWTIAGGEMLQKSIYKFVVCVPVTIQRLLMGHHSLCSTELKGFPSQFLGMNNQFH